MQISPDKRSLKIGEVRLTWREFLFIAIANASVILIIINAIFHKTGFWCHYPILGMFYSYTVVYAALSGTVKKFLSKFRLGVFILNFVLIGASLIHYYVGENKQSDLFLYNWVLPVILILTLCVIFSTMFFKSVSLLNVLLSSVLMLPQATALFVTALLSHGPDKMFPNASFVLTVITFALHIFVIVNLAFLYFVKVKNKLQGEIDE